MSLPADHHGYWAPTWWWMRIERSGGKLEGLPLMNPSEAVTSVPTAKAKSGGAGGIALEQCINESVVLSDVI